MRLAASFAALLGLTLGLLAADARPALATAAAADTKAKINLSGRQRMLTQQMAKAACFAAIAVQPAQHLAMLGKAHGLFERTLAGLREGDPDQGLEPESNIEVLVNLDQVTTLWGGFRSVNQEILGGGEASEDQLQTIGRVNLPLLRQMHKTVGTIQKVYGSTGSVHPALALAINVSGRQRMLSQKASKEFCFVLAGIEPDANRTALAATVALFTESLEGLIAGDPAKALAPAPSEEIRAQLEQVRALWQPLQDLMLRAAEGGTPSAEEIAAVASQNMPVLKAMNAAVQLYSRL